MKTIKAILLQTVDLIFGLIMFGLLIWYMIDPSQNFTMVLWLVVGYVAYNIINKAKLSMKNEKQ
jgi:predicted transcriptional regulator